MKRAGVHSTAIRLRRVANQPALFIVRIAVCFRMQRPPVPDEFRELAEKDL
jgi:hypothetical protein